MLTYSISTKSSARPQRSRGKVETKDEVLQRNLAATIFKVGDRVRFKKPRRNPVYATVIDVQKDPMQITWSADDVPMNIILEVDIRKPIPNGFLVTKERVKTNVKKLVLVQMGVPK